MLTMEGTQVRNFIQTHSLTLPVIVVCDFTVSYTSHFINTDRKLDLSGQMAQLGFQNVFN